MSTSAIFSQVRAAVDIVDVIGECVSLKRAGREFKGLCPFHDDHKPSMAVIPHKQIFHCFVCGTGGDVFEFVERYHKAGKGEALRMLAQRAGIKLPELQRTEGQTARERIQTANAWACDFFERYLRSATGKAGLDYIRGRGLTDETLAKFRVGMAPNGWTAMVAAANKATRPVAELVEAGLLKKRADGSPYDAFRNRIMFPIVDAGGRIIAFGGRVLEDRREPSGNLVEAKYLNSAESPLFNKSATLYGINHARTEIVRSGVAVVVEGYMDVIACHQCGAGNAVATLGTALTLDHVRSLKNYCQRIVLVFDSDDAGRRASNRALDALLHSSLDVHLTSVPDGKDPCDFCLARGGPAFLALVDAAPDALAYRWTMLAGKFKATASVSERQQAVAEFLAALHEMSGDVDPLRMGLVARQVAGMCGMGLEAVQWAIHALPVPALPLPPAPPEVEPSPAESLLLGCLLSEPRLYAAVSERINADMFDAYRPLACAMMECMEGGGGISFVELLDGLPGPDLRRQARDLERLAAAALEPMLTPGHAEMVRQLAARDIGAKVVRDCLDKLTGVPA